MTNHAYPVSCASWEFPTPLTHPQPAGTTRCSPVDDPAQLDATTRAATGRFDIGWPIEGANGQRFHVALLPQIEQLSPEEPFFVLFGWSIWFIDRLVGWLVSRWSMQGVLIGFYFHMVQWCVFYSFVSCVIGSTDWAESRKRKREKEKKVILFRILINGRYVSISLDRGKTTTARCVLHIMYKVNVLAR